MLSPDVATIRSFEVLPSLPEPLRPLLEIAHNLWWSWNPPAAELFHRLDRGLWESTHHNPVALLGRVSQAKLEAAARDDGFLTSIAHVRATLNEDLARAPWHHKLKKAIPSDATIAYFCAEFGLAECLQIYSGGLGCLAGDHLKSASELGLPLVAIGLLYRHGYFQQYLSADGWQQETSPDLDFANLPIEQVKDARGKRLVVQIELPGRPLHIALWKALVGRVPLYLLDTNLPANRSDDRAITGQLYGGDMEMRIRQELVLGIGGVRALEAVGIRPDVCHMNEGHSAFLALERIRRLIQEHDISFDEAREQAAASHVFTTHTPVPAGIDRFPIEMVKHYFESYIAGLRLDMEGLLSLGRDNVFNKQEPFSMATLAIRTSEACNGVSRLHGEISRDMWQDIWPGVPEREIPITHVTNGVHARTWLSDDLVDLLGRYLGPRWRENPADQTVWTAIHDVPDEELWRLHERRRQQLIIWTRKTLRGQLAARGVSFEKAAACADGLSDNALTIGFARRFATYKRGNLILRDAQRIKRIIADARRPVQFLIAGKAHPADGGGKELIRQLVRFGLESEAGHKIVFIENYDIHVARYLVQGCDLWLNTPRRGMEASGTSGMKAAINGVLNCSVLDGWWDEAYQPHLGWAIGRREEYPTPEIGDEIESKALYDLLEEQIVPLFYQRDDHGVPREWVARMKRCIAGLAPKFNTNRMVRDYAEQLYFPALRNSRRLAEHQLRGAIELSRQKKRLREAWDRIAVIEVAADTDSPMGVRESRAVEATVELGDLKPTEVRVQVYAGKLDNDNRLIEGAATDLRAAGQVTPQRHRFEGELKVTGSGRHGFAVRVIPADPAFERLNVPGLIHWEHHAAPAPDRSAPEAAAV